MEHLFPSSLPSRQWMQFQGAGHAGPVCGTIFRTGEGQPTCGVPLGAIGTGCIDLQADGTWGRSTLFNRFWGWDHRDQVFAIPGVEIPARHDGRAPLNEPVWGLVMNGRSRILSTRPVDYQDGIKSIEYWGHYPVVDMQYETGLPVAVQSRTWCPFIPGDLPVSETPAAVFEMHLENTSNVTQSGKLVFNFPGFATLPDCPVVRKTVGSDGLTLHAETGEWQFAIGCDAPVEVGDHPGSHQFLWRKLTAYTLPLTERDPGACAVTVFTLVPGETRVVRFFLSWWASGWHSDFPYGYESRFYRNHYTLQYSGALAVMDCIRKNHESWLKRIHSWQQAFYSDDTLPLWLRDQLVNSLHVIAEDSLFAVAEGGLSKDHLDGALFSLIESSDAAGQPTCTPCDWFGNFPVLYFFPQLTHSTLRGLRLAMREDGAIPFYFGQGLDLLGGCDFTTAIPQDVSYGHYKKYAHDRQRTLNGCCFTDLVRRQWKVTGDDTVLREFYPAVKACTEYTMNLIPGEDGVVSAAGDHWYESMAWPGMTSQVGIVRLAHLRQAEDMALAMGDERFASQCREWFAQATRSLENKLWKDGSYLLFKDEAGGYMSDMVMPYQLDGDWMGRFHGLGPVLPQARTEAVMETVLRLSMPATRGGILNVIERNGTLTHHGGRMGAACIMPGSVFFFVSELIYNGRRDVGLEIARRCMDVMIHELGMPWDLPNMFEARLGEPARWIYGTDYYQCLSLWSIPAALENENLNTLMKPGSLVDRVLKAAKKVS